MSSDLFLGVVGGIFYQNLWLLYIRSCTDLSRKLKNVFRRLQTDVFFCFIGIRLSISGSVLARVAGILILYSRFQARRIFQNLRRIVRI